MPLIPPALDDRSYSDLVQDMLDSIPAHTPEWTIQQTGDPGRTLIELFAWLADSILYRANLIPERQRLAFLKLLGPAIAAGSGGDRHSFGILRSSRYHCGDACLGRFHSRAAEF